MKRERERGRDKGAEIERRGERAEVRQSYAH